MIPVHAELVILAADAARSYDELQDTARAVQEGKLPEPLLHDDARVTVDHLEAVAKRAMLLRARAKHSLGEES
jgi:hypothetical protein